MTIAFWMILVAAMLPYLTVSMAKAGRSGYDNAAPRAWASALSGWKGRAEWAHRNHFEAFPAFAASVIVATLAHAPQSRIDALAGAFILFRVSYTAAYLGNAATLRSALWMGGFVCVILLFVIAA